MRESTKTERSRQVQSPWWAETRDQEVRVCESSTMNSMGNASSQRRCGCLSAPHCLTLQEQAVLEIRAITELEESEGLHLDPAPWRQKQTYLIPYWHNRSVCSSHILRADPLTDRSDQWHRNLLHHVLLFFFFLPSKVIGLHSRQGTSCEESNTKWQSLYSSFST